MPRTSVSAPVPDAPELPSWAAALPLWAASAWLWITVPVSGPMRYRVAEFGGIAANGLAERLSDLPLDRVYPLLILDYRSTAAPDDTWWPALAAALAGHGPLYVCGQRWRGGARAIARAAPDLWPANWHVLELGHEGHWRLRPAAPGIRRLLNRQLEPPYGGRAWVARAWPRAGQARGHVACLPVWRRGVEL